MTEQANHGTRPAADMEGDAEQPKLKRKEYEKELRKLQTELCSLQDWVKQTGERIIVVFEGRDATGKGGTIRALTERVSPRTFRLVALPASTSLDPRARARLMLLPAGTGVGNNGILGKKRAQNG